MRDGGFPVWQRFDENGIASGGEEGSSEIRVMIWLRIFLYTLPVYGLLVFGWLFVKVGELEYVRDNEEFVCLIGEPIRELNPLIPHAGISREVTGLVFDPLLKRNAEMRLAPHILTGWRFESFLALWFADPEKAAAAEERVGSPAFREKWEIGSVYRDDRVLAFVLSGYSREKLSAFLENFEEEELGKLHAFRVRLDHSGQASFQDFLAHSGVQGKVKMLDFASDELVQVFVEGDPDLFLEALESYYQNNSNLSPEIETLGERSHSLTVDLCLELRDDVVWHDGVPLTAGDLIFSLEELTREDSIYPLGDAFRFVDAVELIDEHRLRVTCVDPPSLAVVMESWEALPVLPAHHLESREQSEWASFFRRPVGNGPYRMTGRRQGGVELAAFPSYFLGAPVQEKVVYRHSDDPAERSRWIRLGEVDAYEPREEEIALGSVDGAGFRAVFYPPRIQTFVAWNLRRDLFGQRKVREALAASVDVRAVLAAEPTFYERPSAGLFFPGVPYSADSLDPPRFQPERARLLLQESGWSRDGEGVFSREGEPFAFSLLVNRENPDHLRWAEHLAAQWKSFGVIVRIEEKSWSGMVTEYLSNREFDAILLGWEVLLGRDRYHSWHSSQAGPGRGNFSGLSDPEVDQLVTALREAPTLTRTAQLATALERRISTLQPCLFLCDTGRCLLVKKNALCLALPAGEGRWSVSPSFTIARNPEIERPWWVKRVVARSAGLLLPGEVVEK